MGLIPESTSPNKKDELTEELSQAILETFSLVIINEWDLQNRRRFRSQDLKPGRYMATRYLQLQHPSRSGKTSGDGRGIWNGEITHRGVTWDVMSSGTGATCLSPATAISGRFFQSGDPKVCYGNGYNSIDDGLSAALMSEIFHLQGISTERTLALIVFPGGSSINVRAGKNLLRPSHFFCHLKQGNLEGLKNSIHYCIERERKNGQLELPKDWNQRGPEFVQDAIRRFCTRVAEDFARSAARYESDYIFCWMDWDGDNILVDGGIIDYGSIRQFGGYHAGYRYDDGDRYSTRLGEQKGRARYIIQTFAQIQDFLITGKKSPIAKFARDPLVKRFEEVLEQESRRRLLWKSGLSSTQISKWMTAPRHRSRLVAQYFRAFQKLERLQCQRGKRKVADGETTDAVFVMSRFLREYPQLLNADQAAPEQLIQVCKSRFARKRDLLTEEVAVRRWQDLQRAYDALARDTAKISGLSHSRVLREWRMRASIRLPDPPVTGDGVLGVMEVLLSLPRGEVQKAIRGFVERFRTPERSLDRLTGHERHPLLERAFEQLQHYGDGI